MSFIPIVTQSWHAACQVVYIMSYYILYCKILNTKPSVSYVVFLANKSSSYGLTVNMIRLRGYKAFLSSTLLSIKLILHMNVKMRRIVGIFNINSRINDWLW